MKDKIGFKDLKVSLKILVVIGWFVFAVYGIVIVAVLWGATLSPLLR